jgi:hypothetical protein
MDRNTYTHTHSINCGQWSHPLMNGSPPWVPLWRRKWCLHILKLCVHLPDRVAFFLWGLGTFLYTLWSTTTHHSEDCCRFHLQGVSRDILENNSCSIYSILAFFSGTWVVKSISFYPQFYTTVKPILNGISRVQNIFPLKPGFHLIKVYCDSHGIWKYFCLRRVLLYFNWTCVWLNFRYFKTSPVQTMLAHF